MSTTTALPFTTLLYATLPQHPLLSLLSNPVITRIATVEHRLLLSSASVLLQRIPGVGSKSVLLLTLLGAGSTLGRWRGQWKAIIGALGVGEAGVRGFNLLDELESSSVSEEGESARKRRIRAEIKHLVCFWSLFAFVSVAETWLLLPRTLSATNSMIRFSITTRRQIKALLRSFRLYLTPHITRLILQLRAQLPPLPEQFASVSFPSLSSLAFLLPSPSTKIKPHPQPIAISASSFAKSTRTTIGLPELFFSSPARYELFKVLLLWTGLRRDGWGATMIWDWILGPIYAVARSRGGVTTRTEVRVVVVKKDIPATISSRPTSTNADVFDSTVHYHPRASSPSSLPLASTPHTYNDNDEAEEGGEEERSYSESGLLSPETSATLRNSISTPNIPYRLTSLSHPIHARMPSSTSTPFDALSPAASPSRVPSSSSSSGGYSMDLNGRSFIQGGAAEQSWRNAGKKGMVGDERWD